MKPVYFILFISLVMISFSAAAQNNMKKSANKTLKKDTRKENAFGLSVFKALQEKNADAWVSLYPTNDEYKAILQIGLAAKAEGLTQQIINDIIIRRKNEAAAAYQKQFTYYCQLADNLGINLTDAVFEKFNFTEVYPEPVKLKYLDAMISFSFKKQHFVIDGVQAVDIPSGYKLQALAGIRRVEDNE